MLATLQVSGTTLSPSAQISIITADPGDELYSTFGHSAIRVKDIDNDIDYVFNYGTFNFNTPNFYVKFARGQLPYMLAIQDFDAFVSSYIYENRSLREQLLNLSVLQKQAVFNFLIENYKPENRAYAYDFFYDNCATRIRDVFDEILGDSLIFELQYQPGTPTFRNLIDPYIRNLHWSKFGIYLGLGLPADRVASPQDYMFLPDYLEKAFANASYFRGSERMSLVKNQVFIFQAKPIKNTFSLMPTPLVVMVAWLFAVLLITFWEYKRDRYYRFFDIYCFGIVGLFGWVVFLLWFFTDHNATVTNLNILWAVPLYFPVVFGLLSKRYIPYAVKLIRFCMWVNVLLLLGWFAIPQNFHYALVPLIISLIIRAWIIKRSQIKYAVSNK